MLNILYTVFRIDVLILDTMMEATVSQISDLGPRLYFMKGRKQGLKKSLKVTRFFNNDLKNKT